MPTRTVRQSGGDFSTLAAALADAGTIAGDTMSIEEAWTVNDTSAATVSDSDIAIETDDDSYHDGIFDTSQNNYRLSVSGANCITVNNPGCTIDGIVIVQAGAGVSDEGIRLANSDGGVFSVANCIILAATTTNNQDGIRNSSSAAQTVNIENTILYGWSRGGISIIATGGSDTLNWNFNSLTLWDCNAGDEIRGGGVNVTIESSTIVNISIFNTCILDSNGALSDDYNDGGSATGAQNWNIHNSIDSDGSITDVDAAAVGAIQNRTPTDNPSPGVGDFVIFNDITTALLDVRLQDNSADNDAQDAHSATSGAGLTLPILDIEEDTRERGANEIDIGADSIPTVIPPPPDQPGLPEYGQGRAAIGDPSVYGATIVRS